MNLLCTRNSVGLGLFFVGFFAFTTACGAQAACGQNAEKPGKCPAQPCAVHDVHSRHFLIHTDLSGSEADGLAAPLEAMLARFCAYWGQPLRGVIECNVIRNPDKYPGADLAPDGVRAIKTVGGMTLVYPRCKGRDKVKAVVYSSARPEVIRHEVLHAYCHQTFGRAGPVWYAEGMAEMGHYWNGGHAGVHADSREIEFLRNNPPTSLAAVLSPAQVSGDCWQNYASRWALCHFLYSNPNYSRRFRQLGQGLLEGKRVSFEQTFAANDRELFFEYSFFLRHISRGYRVDLCAWDWKRRFACLDARRVHKALVAAGRGWQPSGLSVRAGTKYEYLASGGWQIAGRSASIDADGDGKRNGRLVGVLMKDGQLGGEFELGAKGSLQLQADGDLYLRCRSAWDELTGDSGQITVKFQLSGQGSTPGQAR